MYHKIIKSIVLSVLLSWSAENLLAQTPGFMQEDVIKIPGITTDAQIAPLAVGQKQTTRTYVDGLSRVVQVNMLSASPLQKDIIQTVSYDVLGRQTTSYLPYVSTDNSGLFRAGAAGEQTAYYVNGPGDKVADDSNPYSQQVFENSPLQRLLQAGSVGSGFQPGQHYKSVNYRPNTSGDNVIQWGTDASYQGAYGANVLAVTDMTDEDGMETLSYKDLAGHQVLKRQVANQTVNGVFEPYFDTYYIYNSAGAISYIVPPKAVAIMNNTTHSYSLSQTGVVKLIFSFEYDNLGRLINKTIPGAITLSVVYDPLNRPVLMQDANLRANGQWNYIKYDVKGRAISQGIYTDNRSRSDMQIYVNGLAGYASAWYESRTGSAPYYTNNIFPAANIQDLAYSFYDDYDLNQDGNADYVYSAQGLSGEASPTSLTRGMLTMVNKRSVGAGLNNIWLLKVMFYDKRSNVIQVQSNNQLNYSSNTTVTDYSTSVPDFTGHIQIAKVIKATGTTIAVQTAYSYDHMFRVTAVDQTYNSQAAVRIAAYEYNELGQVVKKDLKFLSASAIPSTVNLSDANSLSSGQTANVTASGSITLSPNFTAAAGSTFTASIATNYLQAVDYRYNIRGQLLTINNSKLTNDNGTTNNDSNDLFGMQLLYDQVDGNLGNAASYSGRISGVEWMSRDGNNGTTNERSYKYSYDQLNRITASSYAERAASGVGAFNLNAGGFDESGISYDENGNILTLNRNSSSIGAGSGIQVDNLNYTYDNTNPNQLQAVSDGSGINYTGFGFRNMTGTTSNYSYNDNGSLTTDPYKGLSIGYNQLSRTDKITVTTATNRFITYTYDATGVLIRKQQYDNNSLESTTDYIDGFVYVNSALSYAAMPEGRVINTGGTLTPEYIITDQQGNARFSFQDNGSGGVKIVQENSYYAFGLNMANSPVTTPTLPNTRLYNGGSEWQNDYGNLPDLMQTFYRNFDAALGRFIGVDPMAESAESMTNYQYAGNNPIMGNDPMGDYYRAVAAPPDPNSVAAASGGLDGTSSAANSILAGNAQDEADINAFYTESLLNNPYLAGARYGTSVDPNSAEGRIILGRFDIARGTASGISFYFDSNNRLTGVYPNTYGQNTFEQTGYNAKTDTYDHYNQLSESQGLSLLKGGGLNANQGGDCCKTGTDNQGARSSESLLNFVGFNHGIPQFESSLLNNRGAFTPGPFIVYPTGGSKNPYYNTHEPGHVIQFYLLGPVLYGLGVILPSIATANSPNAMQMPWEKSASTLNYWFFGTSDPSNPVYKTTK